MSILRGFGMVVADAMDSKNRNYSLLLLQREDGKFLFQLRTDDAPNFPGVWGFFGGSIEPGESPERALHREAMEELGYECRTPKLVLHIKPGELKNIEVDGNRYLFIEPYDSRQELELSEGKGMDWFTFEEVSALRAAPHIAQIGPRLSSFIGTP